MYNQLIVQEDQQNIRLACEIAEANPADDIMYRWNYHAGIIRK